MTRLRIPDLSVRRLGPDDVEILQSLLKLFRPREHPSLERLEFLLEQRDQLYFAAMLRKQPVGWAAGYVLPRFTHDECFLYEIDVAVPVQRQGVATAMVGAIQDWARKRGIGEIFVVTDVGNESARGLYAGSGAKPAQTESILYTWNLHP
ncbi:MAG: GNAT family N-acetyltransferase [Candidatus Sericytochromatia bacterium]